MEHLAGLLPSVGDESFSPIWIVVIAIVAVAVAVVLRMRNR